jgi:RNA polymerase sigma factor (sigma-70 family)
MIISDDLIQACIDMDRVAQKQLYQTMYAYLNSVSSRYANTSTEAKDILQTTYIRIFTNLEKYNADLGQFKSWCCRICINEALNFKRAKNNISFVDTIPDTQTFALEHHLDNQITIQELRTIIDRMKESDKTILMMYFFDELNHKEISEILDIQEPASRARLSRARTELLTQWRLMHG